MISLNAGSRSTYEWLAGADKYDLVISIIKNFFSIRERVGGNVKPKVVIQILETKKTESEIKKIREKHLNSQWNDIPECSRCDFWNFSQNIWFKFNKRWF